MNSREFVRLTVTHRLRGERTIAGCRAVLVDGLTAYAAAQKIGINEAALSRALGKLRSPLCPHCHQPMPRRPS